MNQFLVKHVISSSQRIQLVNRDITQHKVDGNVSAANANLHHGGGVVRVILRLGEQASQSEIEAWVRKNGPVQHEEPAFLKVWTSIWLEKSV